MKKTMIKWMSLLLALCMVMPLAACVKQDGDEDEDGEKSGTAVDAGALFEVLLSTVKYDTELADVSGSAEFTYAGLPEGAKVTRYAGNAYFADELTWVVLANAADKEAAMEIIEKHVEQTREHFEDYQPEEAPKLDKARIWSNSKNIILCITADDTAKDIVENPGKYVKESKPAETTGNSGSITEPSETEPGTEPPTEQPTQQEPVEYPALIAQNTSIQHRDAYMVVDNVAYEYYSYSESAAENYAKLVSTVADRLAGETNVYSMVIPTAVGVTFPDNVEYSANEDQAERLTQIFGKMSSNVIPVNIHSKLMQHRDEYLYYHTDWHWTGLGAYYGYERFCEIKGVAPYTLDQRQEHISQGYAGPFSAVSTPDDIYAYDPYYKDEVTFVYTDANGNSAECPVIRDDLAAYWYVFAAGDQPYSVFTNSAVTDGSVAIVVKESFGCALMSYICDHYSTVYEIDYRYWQGDLVDFAREVGATDILFANNIGMVRSSYLIGLLANIIP